MPIFHLFKFVQVFLFSFDGQFCVADRQTESFKVSFLSLLNLGDPSYFLKNLLFERSGSERHMLNLRAGLTLSTLAFNAVFFAIAIFKASIFELHPCINF